MKNNTKIRHGFTLVETLVVLTISALVLSLSLFIAHDFNVNRFRNYLFWKDFQGEFELYESLARRHCSSVTIDFRTVQHRIDFVSRNSKIHQYTIKEPGDLSTKQSYRVRIGKDGHVDPKTIIWRINGRPGLDQRFQLGWGMYTIEDSK